MGFLNALRTWGESRPLDELDAMSALDAGTSHPEFPGKVPAADPAAMASPPVITAYDREQWRKKLKRILEHLPQSQGDWDDLHQEAGALNFGQEWVAAAYREEFNLLIHQVVADRVVRSDEHRNLDLARTLMGITDAEAEGMLHAIVAEAETFFGGKIEGA